jgi:cell division septation protein DedD
MPPLHISLLVLVLFTPLSAKANTTLNNEIVTSFQKAPLTSSAKQHFVQFFSTINATKAEGMKNTLVKQGFPAFVNIRSQQKKPHYQVQMGPFMSRGNAQQAKLKVIQHYPEFSFLNSAILKSTL